MTLTTTQEETKNLQFTMPGNSVTMAANTQANTGITYVVNHYVMDTSGNYSTTPTQTEPKSGFTDQVLTLETLKLSSLEVTNGIAYSFGLDDGSGPSDSNAVLTSTVLSDNSRVIDLYYAREAYTLTLNAGTDITLVTTLPSNTYYYGASIDISATMTTEDYTFISWEASPSTVENVLERTTTITMPAHNLTLTANAQYRRTVVEIEVLKEGSAWNEPVVELVPAGGGSSISSSDFGSVPDGTYKIYVDGVDTGRTIDVNFDNGKCTDCLEYYTLTLTGLDGVDSVKGSGVFLAGSKVDIDALLQGGYNFDYWDEIGTQNGLGSIQQCTTQIVMPAANLALSARATFVGTQVTVEIDKDGSPWTGGDAPKITLVPAGGGDAIDDLSSVPDGTYKIYADGVDTGQTVTVRNGVVTFSSSKLEYFTLTLIAGNGVDQVIGGGVYLAGTEIDISALLNDGYTFVDWTGWDGYSLTDGKITITMPAHDLTLTANAKAADEKNEEAGSANVDNNGSGAKKDDTDDAAGTLYIDDDTSVWLPRTGDETQVGLFVSLMLLAAACIAGTFLYRRKNKGPKSSK